MTDRSLLEIHDSLPLDEWRLEAGFTKDFEETQTKILRADSPGAAATAVREWLHTKSQPCIFGRLAAKQNRMTVCVLREHDISKGDDHVRDLIKRARKAWQVAALAGAEHSFLVLASSERLIAAEPGPDLLDFARRLLALYLPDEEERDGVVFDQLFFQIDAQTFRAWENGVNVFAAQGDRRWWQDHRIPGGLAYAMNAVGHMARAHVYPRGGTAVGPMATEAERSKLLNWALPTALLTINEASKGSPRGSWLVQRAEGEPPPPFCPHSFRMLEPYAWKTYEAAFHTDHTLPLPFFRPDVARPEELADHKDLDFSYLHDDKEADYKRIGTGEDADPTVSLVLRSVLTAAEEDG